MEPTNQKITILEIIRPFVFHTAFILTTISLLFIRALPLLLDPHLEFEVDEAFHAREIWELLQGRELFFYYENVNYHGIVEGLAAIPFVKLLGFYPLPFKLPATIFYGLFIWSTFLILRTFNPTAGWIASVLLLFPPNWVITWAILNNYVFSPTLFLGNLTLYYLIKSKTNYSPQKQTVFLLCFFSGLAIYVWTYSIIYIFTIVFLLTLTHPEWNNIRTRLSAKRLYLSFKLLKTKKEKISRILDTFIYLFIFAIILSYVFGGFGLDVGGTTILQINNLHKPVLQVIPIIIIRFLLGKANLLPAIPSPLKYRQSFDKKLEGMLLTGAVGFILGILPRILSILNGSISRGGQGFDVDFSPLRIIVHTLQLVKLFPSFMGLDFEAVNMFMRNQDSIYSKIQVILLFPVAGLTIYSIYSFLRHHWNSIKNLAKLKRLSFSPSLILLILPATLCGSVIISMNGPLDHYLIPLYWAVTIYVAVFITKTIKYSKLLATTFLAIWVTFYSTTVEYSFHEFFKLKEFISPYSQHALKSILTRSQEPLVRVINFLNSKNINAIYSDYPIASKIIIIAKGKIAAAAYSRSARSKRLREKLENYSDFAIVLPLGKTPTIFLNFLKENKINFKQNEIYPYIVLWDFKGDPYIKNQLRYVID